MCNQKILGTGEVQLDTDESPTRFMYNKNKSYKLDHVQVLLQAMTNECLHLC